MIGIDILEIDKVNSLMSRDRFFERVFTQEEMVYLQEKKMSRQTIAGLYAAKEAVAKMFGLGIAKGLGFKDIEVLHDENMAPYLNLKKKIIRKLMDKRAIKDVCLSISHDGDKVVAVASANLYEDQENSPEIDKEMAGLLPERNPFYNKYDYGKVLIIGGKQGMGGAITLAAKASLRSGVGITCVLVPDSISQSLSYKLTEVIIHSQKSDPKGEFSPVEKDKFLDFINGFDAVAIGPGMGQNLAAKRMLELIIENYEGPLVIDADGINVLSKEVEIADLKKNIYITAHEMEFARISGYSVEEIRADRLKKAQEFVNVHDVNLLIKGPNSLIINRRGHYINKTGNSGMATAGSGDSLTGILVGLLARKDSIDMLRLAAYIHGLAGDYCSQEMGEDSMLASDIINYLPRAFKDMRKEQENE